jgi:outer membrane protein OmpA-like peptidoglycan-associated protein
MGVTGSAVAAEEGFALDRFEPAERGSEWFALESLDFRGHGRFAVGIVGDWSHRPLVLYDESDNEVQELVGDQVYAYVGASVLFWDRLRLSGSMPVVLVNAGEDATPGVPSVDVANGATLGDARFGADVRVIGETGDLLSLALGTRLHFPTGSSEGLTGGNWRLQPHLLAAGKVAWFEYAASTGLDLSAQSRFAGQERGSEWLFAVAGGVRLLDQHFLLGPELWGATLVSSSLGAFDKEGTPIEVVLGAHYQYHEWNFGAGMGPGLSRGFGSPSLRALASVQWILHQSERSPEPTSESRSPDRDADGISNAEDACPAEAGPTSADPTRHGCPLRQDGDADTILDPDDACPAQKGEATNDPSTNGCPAADADGDGILDREDACSHEPGDANSDAARHGCPLPTDRDRDQIPDAQDSCPDQAGEFDADPHINGCPRVSMQGDRLRVLDRIEFENAKATLTPESEPILSTVAQLLVEHSEIRQLDIQGHTDSRGQHAQNLELSRRRAAAVKRWLIDHGIAAERLTSHGFGSDQPLGDNESDAARQRNRRVEFHVLATEAAPASDAGGSTAPKP